MSGNPNMRPAGYRSKFGTTATTAREYWNIYCFAIAIGFHSLAKAALDAHLRVIEQELDDSMVATYRCQECGLMDRAEVVLLRASVGAFKAPSRQVCSQPPDRTHALR